MMRQVSKDIERGLDALIRKEIEASLMTEPLISDCAIRIRESADSVSEPVLYFVPKGPIKPSAIREKLAPLNPADHRTTHLVPLSRLPLTCDGGIDHLTLDRIPVLDSELLEHAEHVVKQLPGVRTAAVVQIADNAREEDRYHLEELLPAEPRAVSPQPKDVEQDPRQSATANEQGPALVIGDTRIGIESGAANTLLEVLRNAVTKYRDRPIRFILADGKEVDWTYGELWTQAESIHAGLIATGQRPGDKVVFQLRSNPGILAAFWGCQMAGLIPVIVEVPTSYEPGGQSIERLTGVLRLLGHPLVVADEAVALALSESDEWSESEGRKIRSINELMACDKHPITHRAEPDDVAFFNLSSGSTGVPKCIMLTHTNLLSRALGANQLCGYAREDVILSWLPFDHIGSISDWHIRSVLLGCDLVYADKDYVLGNPLNWLGLIDRFRVTHSWAPNFAFNLIRKHLDHANESPWDLSCVKGLLTAGEAISDSSVHGFVQALAKCGFKATAVHPAFGMAELGSGITYFVPTDERPLRFHTIRKPSAGAEVARVAAEEPGAMRVADLGPPIPGVSLRIVDQDGNLLPMETVGRLQVKGKPVFAGYFDNDAANAAAFQSDGWFNTGDLGFLSAGSLALTGREKETIIIKGANYYSHEIEELASQVAGVEPSFTAACGVRRAQDAEEKLALFFVAGKKESVPGLIRAVRTLIAKRHGISPTYLIPVETQEIPKTPIGKIQRNLLKRKLETGQYDEVIRRVDLMLGNANTLPAWFYRTTWIPRQILEAELVGSQDAAAVLMDRSGGLGSDLCDHLRALGRDCFTVTAGKSFADDGAGGYTIDFRSAKDFRALAIRLQSHPVPVSQIISLIDYRSGEVADPCSDMGSLPEPLNVSALLHLARVLADPALGIPIKRLIWVASDGHGVTPDERGSPDKAMITCLIRSLRAEQPGIDCLHIDLQSADHASNARLLAAEVCAGTKESSVAYRQRTRYVPRLEQLDLLSPSLHPFTPKQGGRYLITGGLGGLGFELCRRLGRDYQAKLLIVGRTALSAGYGYQPSADGERQQAARRYQALLDDKVDCTYRQADVCKPDSIRDVLEAAESVWGSAVDGIFHLAGQLNEVPLDQETAEQFSENVEPKRAGTIGLGELLKKRQGAFLCAFSSVITTFGGTGTGSYAAGNAFMEAYCRQLRASGLPALCYAWSMWDGIGMSSGAATKAIAAAKGFRAITANDGINSLFALLHSGHADAIVGLDGRKLPIQTVMAHGPCEMQGLVGFVECDDEELGGSVPGTVTLQDRFGTPIECRLQRVASLPLMEDGSVDTARLLSAKDQEHRVRKAPKTPVEVSLVEIWRDLLQVADIGTEDNFFELGGDSLLAVQLVAAIGKAFEANMPVSTVFHAPTIAELAARLQGNPPSSDCFSLAPIRTSGSKPALFVVQSVSWNLVHHLDPDQPVYVLNYGVGARSTAEMLSLPAQLEDLAAHYVREIQNVQASGPYFIIGHSGAGLIAYEMAQQLTVSGERVGLVGLIDTFDAREKEKRKALARRKKLSMLLRMPRGEAAALVGRYAWTRFLDIRFRLFGDKSHVELASRTHHLCVGYKPHPYSGRIAYWKCTKQSRLEPPAEDERKWETLAQGGMELHVMPCHHYDIMREPNVRTLAEHINKHCTNA